MRTAVLTQLGFVEAATAWLETRKPYLKGRTWEGYQDYIKVLGSFFGETRLPEITGDHLRAYQKMRMLRAGASIINHECSVVRQILKRIGMPLSDYQALPLPKESPHRALTPAEEERFYRIGPQFPEWDVAFCAFAISINTTFGPGEMRFIRLMDIEIEARVVRVQAEGAKNSERMRGNPLNEQAYQAVVYLLKRARELGVCQPHHYLIPFRIKRGTYDPERPAKGWRTAHNQLMGACGINVSPYSGRHHAITKLLEDENVSEQTAEAIAGHIGPKMKKRYAHIRMEAKWRAVEALNKIRMPVQNAARYNANYLDSLLLKTSGK